MDIKEILDNYSEQPSEEVWKRLSERLDAEMPVARSRRTVWKWIAAAVTRAAIPSLRRSVISIMGNRQR